MKTKQKIETEKNNNVKADETSEGSIAETLWDEYKNDDSAEDESIVDSLMTKKNENIQIVGGTKNVQDVEIVGDVKNIQNIKEENDDKKRAKEHLAKKKTKSSWIYKVIFVIIFGVSIASAFMLGRLSNMNTIPSLEPVVQQEAVNDLPEQIVEEKKPEEQVVEEKVREADFLKTNILVLNGGTEVGVAGKLKDLIVKTDSSIENIEAKNAVGNYASGTIIYYQEDFEIEAKKIGEILEKKYGQLEIVTMEEFPEDEIEENVAIIIGKE